MKNKFLIALSGLLFFCSGGSCDESAIPSDNFIQNIEVGGSLINYRYTEPGLISHSGYLLGVFTRVPMKLTSGLLGLLDSEIATGNLDYNGSICDINTNVCTDYKSKTNDFIFKTVYRFNFLISNKIELFVGPGIRYLYDKGLGSGFYTRIGTYFFIPLGMKVNFEGLSGNFNLELEYDLFFGGTMKSKISEVNSTFTDVNHKQTKGSGSKVLLRYNFKNRGLFLDLAYENWTVADSNVEPLLVNGVNSGNYFVEPKNFTDTVSIGAGYRY